VFFPTRTAFETSGSSFVNQEGRIQFFSPLHQGGSPVSQVSKGSHPPRTHLEQIPGGEPRGAAEILTGLASAFAGKEIETESGNPWAWLAAIVPAFERFSEFLSGGKSLRLVPEKRPATDFSDAVPPAMDRGGEDRMELLLVEQTFGTEELSIYSRFTRSAEKPPYLMMNTRDADRLGLTHGGRVSFQVNGGSVEVGLQVVDTVAPGVMVLPRHHAIPWQVFQAPQVRVPIGLIKRLP
jgi:NADH-quinone oxidoreductase subunit G